jgi:hypothetical protein
MVSEMLMSNLDEHSPFWDPEAREPFLIKAMCFSHDTEFKHPAAPL